MGKKALDTSVMDTALMLREKGVLHEDVAKLCGIGETTLSRIMQAYRAAKDGDVETLRAVYKASRSTAEWAAAKAGIKIPALTELRQEQPAEPEPKQQEQKPDNTAAAFAALLESIRDLTTAISSIDKRLSAMQLTQQGFRADMTQQIKSVVENINVNGDILTKEHEKMIELLSSVKSNTKR